MVKKVYHVNRKKNIKEKKLGWAKEIEKTVEKLAT